MQISQLILSNNLTAIEAALSAHPQLANEGIPYDEKNTAKAHPLHRISDAVFSGKITGDDALAMAKIFVAHGANINGNELIIKQDTPLVAAASLHADELAIYLIEQGANIHHPGCHGGTALHWAAWCGRDAVVKKLVEAGADINKRCIDFMSTPLFWNIHGYKSGNNQPVLQQYLSCADTLLQAGANKTIPNAEGKTVFDLLGEEDAEFKKLLGDF